MPKYILLLLFCTLVSSCSFFKEETNLEAIARANNSYLYYEEIKDLVALGTSKEDSIAIIKNYIDRWASKKLLYDAAEVNLSKVKQEEFNNLVRQYKIDLYSKAYIEQIVKNTVDTVITNQNLVEYYNENKENFRTTEPLIKLKYIHIDKNHPKFASIRSRFLSNKKDDIKALNNISIQFKSFAFNDTTWVDVNQVYEKLPFVNTSSFDKYISSGISYQYPDSTHVYMVKVSNVLQKNQVAPFEYIKPTLVQLIINSRKLELIKKFQKEITDDAIKNKKYEIYK